MTRPFHCPGFYHSNNICQARDARRITAADTKYVRQTAGYAWTEYKKQTSSVYDCNVEDVE